MRKLLFQLPVSSLIIEKCVTFVIVVVYKLQRTGLNISAILLTCYICIKNEEGTFNFQLANGFRIRSFLQLILLFLKFKVDFNFSSFKFFLCNFLVYFDERGNFSYFVCLFQDEEYDSVASTSCDSDNKIFVLSECSNTILTEKCELRPMKFVGNGNNNSSNCSNGNGSDGIIKRFPKKNCERPKNMKRKQERQVLYRRKYNQYQRKTYPCDICDKKFTRFCDLFNHDKVDHESVPKNCMCNVCGKLFVSENRIQIHKDRYHSEKPFTCDMCDKKFLTKRTLQKHMIIHNKCYTCPYCGLCTSSNSSLIEHIRVHTREKPYTCDECGNSYISQQGLNSHKKTHSSEKLFMCDICGYSARNQSSIYIHKGSHSNIKPFICETCGKAFKSKIRLNEHHRRHTAVKRFTCDTCNMSFRQNYQLINHYRVHSGEKPYTCNVCSKSFARSDSLKEHMRIHTGEKRYTCQLCLAAFSFLKSFKTHKCDEIK